ncbi:hypothetical protein L7F22_060441 [Adiantum nelumboides]|nr:hypothetical protein [Adiantum nelumboides]
MVNSPFISFMYQLIEFAFSLIELLFTQLLPTLALLVGASLQFLFDFFLSSWFPNRPSSSSFPEFYPSDSFSDEHYMDADDGFHNDSTATSRFPYETHEEESWWPMQALGGIRRSQAESPRDATSRGQSSERHYANNREISNFITPTERFDRPSRSATRHGDQRLGDKFGNVDEYFVGRTRNHQPVQQLRDDLTARPSRRQLGLSQQSPSRSIYHSTLYHPTSSSSPWFMLTQSIKKYASKFSVFFMSRILRQPNYDTSRWNHPSLLRTAW